MAEQWVYGLHAVQALLENPQRRVLQLYLKLDRQDKRQQAIIALAKERAIVPQNLEALGKKFTQESHQGVVALVQPLPEYQEADIPWLLAHCKGHPLVLVLDGITDVHNLGACLRTADGAGVDFVIVPKDKTAPMNAAVSKVACGAAENIPVLRATNLARALRRLQEEGLWIYGAAGEASQSLYQLDCQRPLALVMGSEDKGLRRLTREHCDGLFSIPMQGTVASLNVSVATGVCLFEVNRARLVAG
ncbi:MAG: 23S rRNA (guanosine(2251)-2'-O)-methyltransferase RlmB [Legionellaceae bacterium]|nr:23S rRNA (guanosine(2251)-2'-O)-methyltransferase RlmB [Legionellaceae bacterium]